MKITILGSTGMLGSTVGRYFLREYDSADVCLSYRNEAVSYGTNKFCFDPLKHPLDIIPPCDYILNCIGVIKPFIENDVIASITINSIFPRQLADWCEKKGIRMIHITTDCVFSGRDGLYDENAPHDCLDIYGKTKSLGEPPNCMVLRTSIIGQEIHKHASLIEWAKSQKGKTINGFTNHLWNGITTTQYAKVCKSIIENDWYAKELFHIFSGTVSKYQLMNLINERFALDIRITSFEAPQPIDRTLATCRQLNHKLKIPPLREMLWQDQYLADVPLKPPTLQTTGTTV